MTDPEPDTRGEWSCSHCGPHPQSRVNWCDKGCGRDYQNMTFVPTEPDTRGVDPLGTLVRNAMRAAPTADVVDALFDLFDAEVAKRQEAERQTELYKASESRAIGQMWEAAGEIQRLRAALERIRDSDWPRAGGMALMNAGLELQAIAAAALDRTPPGNTAPPTTLGEGGDLHWNVRTPEQ